MFSKNKFSTSVLILFILVSMYLSGCAQSTISPKSTATSSMSVSTEVQTITATIEPAETMKPDVTITMLPPSETSVDVSNVTDAMIEQDRAEAFKAATTLISSLPNASQEQIAETVTRKWLAYYTGAQVDAYLRLKDYKFESVKIIGNCSRPNNTVKFAFTAKFSVQSVTEHPGDWVASGDITFGTDHWIYQSTRLFSIAGVDGNYILKSEGVPPCSGS